jgi:hypothetical protein
VCRSGSKVEEEILNKPAKTSVKKHETHHTPKLEHLDLSLPAMNKRKKKEKTQIQATIA